MGTAFLTCDEAGTPAPYRQALATATEDATTVTDAFSGRPARGLVNRFILDFTAAHLQPLSYPWQNALTRPLRRAAAANNDPGALALWAGQGVRMLKPRSARQLMQDLQSEIQRVRSFI